MPQSRRFAQVDVFSAVPFRGNPVAVILDADDLDDAQMAQIANWTNLSETTFILSPTDPAADYRLRIFTPHRELPFAGHPTLGSAAAWLDAGGTPKQNDRIVQECGAGLVDIRRGGPTTAPTGSSESPTSESSADAPTGSTGTLAFAAPERIRAGELDESYVAEIATALGVDRGDILDHQWADNGPGWAAVRLASAEQVLALTPDFSAIPDAKLGVLGAHPDASEHEYEIRAFVPGVGVAEDPVTGSLNASVAQWLIGAGLAPDSYTATQGTALGRAGVISISAEAANPGADPDAAGADPDIWVGGATTVCFRGTVSA
ncbi:PhzF family phenazine biosynthesis protein [Brevibacterium spongiae]|uniref:PhzF family phenazine biosynthesis protein n=1 Tax=Brevibacterium spongiae TaxID=2909672 RepID=A0ABY5SUS7_9MICO|nr:PhzF family phenazine biosynthesis protein [Brevibacterium spongiae]UVI37979.1 PhzF family phenazine biosynthesis protein [Brevibacterium spongiae]